MSFSFTEINAGVKKTKLTWEINPDEVEAVKLAFDMHSRGVGIKRIAQELTALGFRSRRNAAMNTQTIAEWFRNPYPFAGCVVWNTRDHKLKPKPKEKWVIVENAYPAIISMALADKIYEKAQARKWGKMPKKKGNYLLSGMMKCSECDANFVINSSPKRGDAFYVCGTRQRNRNRCDNRLMLHQQEVERQITNWLKETVLEEDFLRAYFRQVIEAVEEQMQTSSAQKAQLTKRLKETDGRIERLIDALADGDLPVEVIKKKIHEEQENKREVEAQLRQLKEPPPQIPDLETFRTELLEALDEAETKKAALGGLIKQIIVHPDATLDIECSIQTCFDAIAPRGFEPRFDG